MTATERTLAEMSEEPSAAVLDEAVVKGPSRRPGRRCHQGHPSAAVGQERPRARRAAGRRAEAISDAGVLVHVAIAFVVFCMAASGIYLVNDSVRLTSRLLRPGAHPTKRFRPIAAGVVPVNLAYALAAVLLAGSIAGSFLASWHSGCGDGDLHRDPAGLPPGPRHQAVLDICIVSSGFLLRAVAGGAAAGIALSQWFLLIMAFGSLFMAAGKRYAELQIALETGAKIRKSLQYYTPTYLRFIWTLAATAVVVFYGLWAFQQDSARDTQWYSISMIPFTIAILRYGRRRRWRGR